MEEGWRHEALPSVVVMLLVIMCVALAASVSYLLQQPSCQPGAPAQGIPMIDREADRRSGEPLPLCDAPDGLPATLLTSGPDR